MVTEPDTRAHRTAPAPLGDRFGVGPAGQFAPGLFLASPSLVSVPSVRSVFGLVGYHAAGLALAALLGALRYGLVVAERCPDLRANCRRRRPESLRPPAGVRPRVPRPLRDHDDASIRDPVRRVVSRSLHNRQTPTGPDRSSRPRPFGGPCPVHDGSSAMPSPPSAATDVGGSS